MKKSLITVLCVSAAMVLASCGERSVSSSTPASSSTPSSSSSQISSDSSADESDSSSEEISSSSSEEEQSSSSSSEEEDKSLTLYFRDSPTWNQYGACTFIKTDIDNSVYGVAMTHVHFYPHSEDDDSVGFNVWSYEIEDVTAVENVTFVRMYYDPAGDLHYGNSNTIAVSLSSRGENDMYDIVGKTVEWGETKDNVELIAGFAGEWGTFDPNFDPSLLPVDGDDDPDPQPSSSWSLHMGTPGSEDWTTIDLAKNPGNENEVMATEVTFTEGQAFKIVNGDNWFGDKFLKDDVTVAHNNGDDVDDDIVLEAGVYNFYINVADATNPVIWVGHPSHDAGEETATIKVTPRASWTTVYIYAWADGVNPIGAWPGVEMAKDGEVYTYDLPTDYTGFVLSNGSDDKAEGFEQTVDIAWTDKTVLEFAISDEMDENGKYKLVGDDSGDDEIAWSLEINGVKESATSEDVDPAENLGKFVVDLSAEDTLKIYKDGTALHFYHWDDEAKVSVDDGDTFTATLEGKHTFWVNASSEIWVTEPVPAGEWYLAGEGSLWEADDWAKADAVGMESDDSNLAKLEGVALAVGDKFKVTDFGTNWLGYDELNSSTFTIGDYFEAETGGNIVVKTAGTFNFYLNASYQIWATLVSGDSGDDSGDDAAEPTWFLAGEGSLWEADDWAKADAVGMESDDSNLAKLEGVALAVGDKFKVTDFGTNWLGYDELNSSTFTIGDYFEAETGGNIVVTAAGAFNFYLNTSYEIWATLVSGDSGDDSGDDATEPTWFLAGAGSLWEADDWAKADAVGMESDDSNLAKLEGVALDVGDKFKVTDYGDNWLGYTSLNSSTFTIGDYFEADADGNIVVTAAGAFNFYLNTSYQIWATLAD